VDKDSFWVNPFGVAFSLIKKSDLIRVSEKGEILEGGEIRLLNTAAFMIHSAVHKARPDVNAAAHSHSIYGRSFCRPFVESSLNVLIVIAGTLGRKLDIITQDTCAFYNVCLISRASAVDLTQPGPRFV
jgi:ribulose-5-phosphate 4-epimerase/fuculose-1-phosphate aldolase